MRVARIGEVFPGWGLPPPWIVSLTRSVTMIPAVLAIDQGTTRTKALIFDATAQPLAESSSEIPLTYPHPGWVEQDPRDLLQSVVENARAALAASDAQIIAFGL